MQETVDLEKIIMMATQVGTRVAMDTINSYEKDKRKSNIDRRLRNTKLLLKNYRNLVKHCGGAVYNKKSTSAFKILEELDDDADDKLYVESIKRSKERTAIIISHIRRMINVYGVLAEKSSKPEELRRYNVIKAMYIDEPKKEVEDIAEENFCNVRTVYRDRNDGIDDLSVLLFGIDGIRN